jgi:hypothetical protein
MHEVDDARWVLPEEAAQLLTYARDRAPLEAISSSGRSA